MKILRHNDFYIAKSTIHGMGVFSYQDLSEDDRFFLPIIKIPRNAIPKGHPFSEYVFNYNSNYYALFGEFGEFINHSSSPNVVLDYLQSELQEFRIVKNIKQNEEILINYGEWAIKKWNK